MKVPHGPSRSTQGLNVGLVSTYVVSIVYDDALQPMREAREVPFVTTLIRLHILSYAPRPRGGLSMASLPTQRHTISLPQTMVTTSFGQQARSVNDRANNYQPINLESLHRGSPMVRLG
jgi:hypothetical protein